MTKKKAFTFNVSCCKEVLTSLSFDFEIACIHCRIHSYIHYCIHYWPRDREIATFPGTLCAGGGEIDSQTVQESYTFTTLTAVLPNCPETTKQNKFHRDVTPLLRNCFQKIKQNKFHGNEEYAWGENGFSNGKGRGGSQSEKTSAFPKKLKKLKEGCRE